MFSAKDLLRFGCVITIAFPITLFSRADTAAASETSPQAAVESFHHTLLDTMQNARSLGPKGRFAELEPVILRLFDMPSITRTVVGRDWERLSTEQQTKLTIAFERFEVAQFADLFDSYGGQRFRSLEIKPAAGGAVIVATVMESEGLPPVYFDYKVHRDADSWRVEDIRFNAWLSIVERRRGELRDVLRRRGFDGLISRLDAHTQIVLDGADNAFTPHLANLRPDAHLPYPLPLPLP